MNFNRRGLFGFIPAFLIPVRFLAPKKEVPVFNVNEFIKSSSIYRVESLDPDYYLVVKTHGKVSVSLQYWLPDVSSRFIENHAKEFKDQLIPDPWKGFHRVSISFCINLDGCGFIWSTTDHERRI